MGAGDVEVGKALPDERGTDVGVKAGPGGAEQLFGIAHMRAGRSGGHWEQEWEWEWESSVEWRESVAGIRDGEESCYQCKNTMNEEGGQHKNATGVRFFHGRPHRTADSAARTP